MSSYKELRGTSVAGLVIGALIPATVWWACLSTDSLLFAWSCASVTALGVGGVMLWRGLQSVEVASDALHVGSAHLEVSWIGSIEAFEGSAWQELLRAGGGHQVWLDARSFHSGGVRVQNIDPNDPVDFWLVSSRHSVALAEALQELVKSQASPEDRTPIDG